MGQGQFRKKVLQKYESRCIITGIDNPRLLLASHIKPWAVSSNAERLNSENGLCLSPAYDLTYSNTYYGEHTTTVDGNGRNPGRKELLTVGIAAGMKKEVCIESMDMVEKCVKNMLGRYL